jgi:hypothetical protein
MSRKKKLNLDCALLTLGVLVKELESAYFIFYLELKVKIPMSLTIKKIRYFNTGSILCD